jgi:nitroreductase
MEFFEVLNTRHSIRAFQPASIEAEKLEQILQAINRAPSAGNRQAYEVYLVQDEARKAALVSATKGQEFLAQAPVALVFCAHPALSQVRYAERGETLYALQDATIACTFAMLAATAVGLSSVWVGSFDEAAVSQTIELPDSQRPVAILPIGYAAEEPRLRDRRPLNEIIHPLE